MIVVGAISLAMLGVAAILAAVFVVRSHNLVDRIVGLDTVVSVLLNGLAVGVALSGGGDAVNMVLLVGLLAFLGTVTAARFIERRGVVADDRVDPGPEVGP
jgi:multicomponent Na+:H+ antiporter subunit F